jgi:signal transduction histidine kinase
MGSALATRWREWPGRRASPQLDAAVAVVLTVVIVLGSIGEAHPKEISDKIPAGAAAAHTPPAAFALVAIAGLVLAVRRRWPWQALAVSTAAVTAYTAFGYINGAALLAPPAALYALTMKTTPRRAIAAWAVVTAVLMSVSGATDPFGITAGSFYSVPILTCVACFGGIAVASRRAYVASIQARAEDAARRRIDDERLRIARELHDVVAHTMATINVQAGAAAHVAPERPQAAIDALQVIRAVSKDGLRELRAILNVLRQSDEPETPFPAPGLAQLDALITSARRAGLEVAVSVTGDARPLPTETDLAAYRIVQESLTNVIRHAGPATAAVTLNYTGSELRIEVTDTGLGVPAAGPNGGGHGLAGMRERAASAGGSLDAGPAAGGGFHVRARLPLRGEDCPGQPAPATEGTRS